MNIELSLVITLAVLMVAAVTDATSYHIPNLLTFPAIIVGLLLCRFPFSVESWIRVIWLAIFFALGTLHIMGMGDLKLCMAVLALRGIGETWRMLLAGAILLFMYCLVTQPDSTVYALKSLWRAFRYHIRQPDQPRPVYPFAIFLGLGYMINFI